MSQDNQNTVIRASAGTGKTFQLSNRFIGLLAAGQPLDGILATTFTRKAAGEILDRVLVRLADAVLDPEKLAELAEHVEGPPLDCGRCLGLLREMLRHSAPPADQHAGQLLRRRLRRASAWNWGSRRAGRSPRRSTTRQSATRPSACCWRKSDARTSSASCTC